MISAIFPGGIEYSYPQGHPTGPKQRHGCHCNHTQQKLLHTQISKNTTTNLGHPNINSHCICISINTNYNKSIYCTVNTTQNMYMKYIQLIGIIYHDLVLKNQSQTTIHCRQCSQITFKPGVINLYQTQENIHPFLMTCM